MASLVAVSVAVGSSWSSACWRRMSRRAAPPASTST